MTGDVFKEDPLGFAFGDDARDLRPEVARIAPAAPPSGDGERLARVARSEEIHDAAPRAAVEGAKVRPNRSRVQGAVCKTRRQEERSRRFDFHVADRASARQSESESKGEAGVTGAEREDAGR